MSRTLNRTLKLQINAKGSWRDVLTFDTDRVVDVKRAAAELMAIADPEGSMTIRIASADGFQKALARWDVKKGWVQV